MNIITRWSLVLSTFLCNAERGWNDPPMFLHTVPGTGEITSITSPPKRNALNRRVFHSGGSPPAAKSAAQSTTPARLGPPVGPPPAGNKVVILPPTTSTAVSSFPAPIIIPNLDAGVSGNITAVSSVPACSGEPSQEVPVDDIEIPHFNDDRQLFHYTASRLQKILIYCKDALGVQGYDTVNRKLKLFESMWDDGKISYPVKAAMAKLAIALHSGKSELANHIHVGLMMDYISEVSQWMVGIKRLIQEAQYQGPFSPVGSPTKTISVHDLAPPTPLQDDESTAVSSEDRTEVLPSSDTGLSKDDECEAVPALDTSDNLAEEMSETLVLDSTSPTNDEMEPS